MSDRDLWLTVRRALLMICKAIEAKYIGVTMITTQDENTTIAGHIDTN